jgi:hypothetical protein
MVPSKSTVASHGRERMSRQLECGLHPWSVRFRVMKVEGHERRVLQLAGCDAVQ